MAEPPPASSSLETSILSVTGTPAPDIFICARRKHPNRRLLQVARTSYTGSEQATAKDGKQDISPSPDERSKHSHEECILQMNTPGLRPWSVPRQRTRAAFILDSGATSHVIGDVSLFSPSFTTPAGSAATYQAHDGRILIVAGIGTVSCDNFRIPNARCVQDLCTGLNLVSVQQLAECGYLAMFGGGQCSVMEQSSGKIVGKGRLHGDDGLYHLEFLYIPHDKACEANTATL